MINALMFGALGFFVACLLALMLAAPMWNRAVKLTTRKLEATMPMSLNDIQADKDQLRAEFAIDLRKVEVALDKAKEKAARELIEANKRRVEIAVLNTDLAAAKAKLQENENANRVLQQTIKRRLPDLDSRLKAAKKALADLESVNAELRATVASQSEALKTARTTLHNQRADIERLRTALESTGGSGLRGLGKADARTLAESQRLTAELSRAQDDLERAKTSAQENAQLRRELSKLASQILAVARGQAIAQPQQRVVVEVAQAYTQAEAVEPPAEHAEETWQPAHAGNGAMHEAERPEESVVPGSVEPEAAAAPPEPESYEPEETIEEEVLAEAEPSKGSFAQRFVARREARRARKGGGASLSARLRGLVAERTET
jgi:predicted  nucleic acid-binding Zn-ribbon protein